MRSRTSAPPSGVAQRANNDQLEVSFNLHKKMPPKQYNRGRPNSIDIRLLSFRRRSEALEAEYWRRYGYVNIPESVFFAAASNVWYEQMTKEQALEAIHKEYQHLHRPH